MRVMESWVSGTRARGRKLILDQKRWIAQDPARGSARDALDLAEVDGGLRLAMAAIRGCRVTRQPICAASGSLIVDYAEEGFFVPTRP
ncbi:MAG: hypothetical protein ACRDQ4_17865 [Pseudonocardiaceae bacterium]